MLESMERKEERGTSQHQGRRLLRHVTASGKGNVWARDVLRRGIWTLGLSVLRNSVGVLWSRLTTRGTISLNSDLEIEPFEFLSQVLNLLTTCAGKRRSQSHHAK